MVADNFTFCGGLPLAPACFRGNVAPQRLYLPSGELIGDNSLLSINLRPPVAPSPLSPCRLQYLGLGELVISVGYALQLQQLTVASQNHADQHPRHFTFSMKPVSSPCPLLTSVRSHSLPHSAFVSLRCVLILPPPQLSLSLVTN